MSVQNNIQFQELIMNYQLSVYKYTACKFMCVYENNNTTET